MNIKLNFLFKVFFLFFTTIIANQSQFKIKLGCELLLSKYFNIIENKKIALCINASSKLSNGQLLLDTLIKFQNVKIKKIFSPEHGFLNQSPAGEKNSDAIHPIYQLPIISLYGNKFKPDKNDLADLDIVIFDIQDIGARFYTYISTMFYLIEACGENNVKVLILDRPNPLSGNYVDGAVIKQKYFSFVGIAQIPICHGMTIGELALFFNDHYKFNANVEVIKMEDWKREFYFDDLFLTFAKPSPNIVNFEAILVYPGTCLLEATNISEGRGTNEPFLTIGSPFLKNEETINFLNSNFKLQGFHLEPKEFIPVSIAGMVKNPKYGNQICKGIKIKITNKKKFEPVKFGIALLKSLVLLHKEEFKFNDNWALKLLGDDHLFNLLKLNINNYDEIIRYIESQINEFNNLRNKYLLY